MTDDFYIQYVLWDDYDKKYYDTIEEYHDVSYATAAFHFAKSVAAATKSLKTLSITLYRGEPIHGAKILMRCEFYERMRKGGDRTSLKGKGS